MIVVETSETISSCENMEFYKFDKLLYFINNYMTKKNDDSGNAENHKNMQEQMSSTMRNMKNTFKLPKTKF